MEEIILRIISDVLHAERELITPELRLTEDLGADSLDLFQMVLKIEETFDISLGNYLAEEKPKTVKDILTRVENRQ